MEIIDAVNSYDEIPQMWRDGEKILDETLYSASGHNWDRRCVTFERKLSPYERKVNFVWGLLGYIFTLGNIFNFGKIRHLLHDTKERKAFDIILKGQKHGEQIPVPDAG